MVDRPAPSKAEMEVARIVWGFGEATVRQVFEAFGPERDIDFATVQTYLRRLESKGYLKAKLRGRAKVYRPQARPKQVIRETVDDFVNRLFGGETLPLLHHLLHDRKMTGDELRELREMVDRLEAEHGSSDSD